MLELLPVNIFSFFKPGFAVLLQLFLDKYRLLHSIFQCRYLLSLFLYYISVLFLQALKILNSVLARLDDFRLSVCFRFVLDFNKICVMLLFSYLQL